MWMRDRIALASTLGLKGCLVLAGLIPLAAAKADVVISSAATRNMTCSDGVCTPTTKAAVLNVSDIETMLSAGNVEISTTGAGVQARDIRIDASLAWSSANTLVLDAYESILVNNPVVIADLAGLSVTTNDGGNGGIFAFGSKGHVNFANLASALTINGAAYTLEGSVAALAGAIAGNPSGDYALAGDYDASKDGTYQNSPIPTEFSGSFEGLGNTVSNLSLNGTDNINESVGFFAELASDNQPAGSVENVVLSRLINLSISKCTIRQRI